MFNETKKTMPATAEIIRGLQAINCEPQFHSFYRSISVCSSKSLNAEEVAKVFNAAIVNANNASRLNFQAAPRPYIRVLVGENNLEFIEEVVKLLSR